jgi:hypothetical protein
VFNLESDNSTSSRATRIERPAKASRRALLSAAVLLSLSCTLTRDDYEPTVVSGLQERADAGASGSAGAPGQVCTGPSCCSAASDCSAGEACSGGICVRACSAVEDPSSCNVPLCPGPSCPETTPSCSDGVQNGREPAVDCGETCPERCGTGSACRLDVDCASSHCADAVCAPATCDDGVQNGAEAAVDCGGGCPACPSGATCAGDGDCASGLFCAPGTHRCTDNSCQDGTLGGNEVLVDCGGGECPGCPAGSPCTASTDCDSNVCSGGACAAASCSDGAVSGDESGVDCGGSVPGCPRCSDGGGCRESSDCESNACSDGACVSCNDETRDGTESDTDCGGSNPDCDRCADGASCNIDDDCASGDCNAGRCVRISCSDGARNGTESDTDCGGVDPLCARCDDGSTCTLDSDCASQSCQGGRCISCNDGVRNGTETDTDCGGSSPGCARCAPGGQCQADRDCGSGACEGGSCCGGSQGDCTRCALRLSPTIDCDVPTAGVDPTGVANCTLFLQCLADNAERCPTRTAPGCSGDNQATDACPHNDYGGNAGTGVSRANQVLQNAGCQL